MAMLTTTVERRARSPKARAALRGPWGLEARSHKSRAALDVERGDEASTLTTLPVPRCITVERRAARAFRLELLSVDHGV